jgi:DNA-directed RNA polymerase alpha subunit
MNITIEETDIAIKVCETILSVLKERKAIATPYSDEHNRLRKQGIKRLKELYDVDIASIKFPRRIASGLDQRGIKTVGELATSSEQHLLAARNFGKRSLYEVEEELFKMGLRLGMEIDKEEFNPSNPFL